MKQILYGAASAAMSASATRYHTLDGMGVAWEDGVTNSDNIVAEAGTLSHLRVELPSAPGAGKSLAFAVMLDGVATALTCTISDTATAAEDSTHSFAIAAGNKITLRCVPTGTPTTSLARWASQFEATTAQRAIWSTKSGFSATALDPTSTKYNPIGVKADSWHASVTARDPIWGIDCTIKSLYVWLSSAPGAGDSYAFTIMKNGVAEASSTVTIADAATTGSITGLSIDVVPGDNLSIRCVPSGTPGNPVCGYGISYQPDTDGQWNWSGMSGLNSDGYIHPTPGPVSIEGTLANRTAMAGAAAGSVTWSLSGVRVELDNAPGAGQSRTHTVVKNGTDTAATVTISGTDTSATGGTSVQFEPGDTWSLHIDESAGAAASVMTRWTYGFGAVEEETQYRLMLAESANPDIPTLNITPENFAVKSGTLVRFERGRDAAVFGNPPRAGEMSARLSNQDGTYELDEPEEGLAIRLNKRWPDSDGTWYHLAQGNISVPMTHFGQGDDGFRGIKTLRAVGSLAKLQGKTISTELYESVTTGAAMGHLLDAAEFPAHLRDLAVGEVTLPYWWTSGEDALSALNKLLNAEGITADLYEDGEGRIVFRDRSARYTDSRSTVAQKTITSQGSPPLMHEFHYTPGSRGSVTNAAEANRIARTNDTVPSIVWEDSTGDGVYLLGGVGHTKILVFEAIADEPFFDAIVPDQGTDFDISMGSVSVTLERTSGQRTRITFTAGASGALIGPATGNDGITLRATTTIARGPFKEISRIDASASISKYGLRPWVGEMWADMDWADMRDNLDAIVTLGKQPIGKVRVGINAVASDEANEAVATLEIGHRIRVIESNPTINLDADCWIERIEHTINAPAGSGDGSIPGWEEHVLECTVVSVAPDSSGTGIGEDNPYETLPPNEEYENPTTGLDDQGLMLRGIVAGLFGVSDEEITSGGGGGGGGGGEVVEIISGEGGPVPAGVYDMLLWLPDPKPSVRAEPAYAIRTANTGTWETATGYNDLDHTITVGSPISSNAAKTYTADAGEVLNPDRGFQYNMSTEPTGYTFIDGPTLTAAQSSLDINLVRWIVNIRQFRATDTIASSWLANLQTDFDTLRSVGMRGIIRVVYDYAGDDVTNDVVFSRMSTHIDQLASVFNANRDVIAGYECGLVGAYGEWWGSTNYATTASRQVIVQKVLDSFQERPVMIRSVVDLRYFIAQGVTSALRLGNHNDAFLASSTDWNMWAVGDPAGDRPWFEALGESRSIMVGGEHEINPSGDWVAPDHASRIAAYTDFEDQHWSYLNPVFRSEVIDVWKANNHPTHVPTITYWEHITRYIGYRIKLNTASLPNTVPVDTDITVQIVLENTGWAAPFNTRDVVVVLRETTTGAQYHFPLTTIDPRTWSGGVVTINATLDVAA